MDDYSGRLNTFRSKWTVNETSKNKPTVSPPIADESVRASANVAPAEENTEKSCQYRKELY